MTTPEADALAGARLARDLIYAAADGDTGTALSRLNEADGGHVRWAAATLLSALVESVKARFGPERLELALKSGADSLIGEDAVLTTVELIIREERNDG